VAVVLWLDALHERCMHVKQGCPRHVYIPVVMTYVLLGDLNGARVLVGFE
jgi:hypothetical protein